MKTHVGLTGSILVTAGCILLARPAPLAVFVYAILLNITGISMVAASLLPRVIKKLVAPTKAFLGEVKDEVKQQNTLQQTINQEKTASLKTKHSV